MHQQPRSNPEPSSNCTRWIIFRNGCPRRCVIIQCGASNLAGPQAISIGMQVKRSLSVGRVAFLLLSHGEIEPLKRLNAAAPWQIAQIISRSKSRDSRAFRRACFSECARESVLSKIAVPWYTTSNSVGKLAINKCERYYRERSAAPKTYLFGARVRSLPRKIAHWNVGNAPALVLVFTSYLHTLTKYIDSHIL